MRKKIENEIINSGIDTITLEVMDKRKKATK